MQTGESRIDQSTHSLIVASDEAGYGAWAGPLVVAAVAAPRDWVPPAGLTDSKKLTEARREALYTLLSIDKSITRWIVSVYPQIIDGAGVYKANLAHHLSVHGYFQRTYTDALHVADGNLPLGDAIVSLPKADALVPAVSAASILAKVTRDRLMRDLGKEYPGYGFEHHMGYGVPAHEEALQKLGPCPIHRMSYAPVKAYVRSEVNILDLLDELSE